ncbi:MAG: ribosome biogenesis GTPase Der [Rhodospirillales bacterium]|nr:ribosome biogenesis GTPase Der [Rhodospirillales bacterium]
MGLTVAILGRPNVGKSTIFNRLVGKRLAIVDDTPGVTRDRREGQANLGDLDFTIIDTAGLEDSYDDSLEGRMREQTDMALEIADVALMVVDARAGVTPLDQFFAKWLRGVNIPIVLLANKCEGFAAEDGRLEAYKLGLGDPLPFSAEHGEGMSDLYDALQPFYDEIKAAEAKQMEESNDEEEEDNTPLQLAIVGRPNVGKSTLINRLIGQERLLTGPEAGVTRDAIGVNWQYKGRPIKIIDTAGLRKKAKVTTKLENLSAADTLRSIRYAQVVVLLLDANDMLEKQDLTIARNVINEGRALIIVANKWDAVENREEALGKLRDRLQTSLPQVKGIPIVTLSALTGRSTDKLLPTVMRTYDLWNQRIPTARLNDWLEAMTESHPPPQVSGRRIKIRYMTQAKTRPPTFILFVSKPDDLPDSYIRYLMNALRDDFNLPGIPLRLEMRKRKNPYVND